MVKPGDHAPSLKSISQPKLNLPISRARAGHPTEGSGPQRIAGIRELRCIKCIEHLGSELQSVSISVRHFELFSERQIDRIQAGACHRVTGRIAIVENAGREGGRIEPQTRVSVGQRKRLAGNQIWPRGAYRIIVLSVGGLSDPEG